MEDTGLLFGSQSPVDPAGSNQDLNKFDSFQVKSTMQRSIPFWILQDKIIISDVNYLNISQSYLKVHIASARDQQQGALFKAVDYGDMKGRSSRMILAIQLYSFLHQDLYNFRVTPGKKVSLVNWFW